MSEQKFIKRFLYFILIGFLFVGCAKKTPKVFVIGDSISIFYGPYLNEDLKPDFVYNRKGGVDATMKNPDLAVGANGGDSKMVVKFMDSLKTKPDFHTDYFLINCGLHDIKHDGEHGLIQIPAEKYVQNLEKIVALSKDMHAKLIWINSTPVVDSIHNKKLPFKRYNQDVVKYNTLADSIMQKANVPVIDLYDFTLKYIPDGYMDHVHFKDSIRMEQAQFIAKSFKRIIRNK